MVKVELRTARKEYRDNISNARIHIGEIYKRVNIKDVGIFHFKQNHNTNDIIKYVKERSDEVEEERDFEDTLAGYHFDIGYIGQD